jgi:hypothetical protein
MEKIAVLGISTGCSDGWRKKDDLLTGHVGKCSDRVIFVMLSGQSQ